MNIIKKLSLNSVANTILVVLLCASIFHALVLVSVIPYTIVWGGRLESASQMYAFETVSLIINLIIAIIVGMKVRYIKPLLNSKVINAILWILVFIFILNTVGNLAAMSKIEAIIFTPLTLISALLFSRLAIEP